MSAGSSRGSRLVEDFAHDAIGRQAVDLGIGRQHDAVSQDRQRQALHIVRDDEVAPVQRSKRPHGRGQRVGGTGRAAGLDGRVLARGPDDIDDIVDDLRRQHDLFAGGTQVGECRGISLRCEPKVGKFRHGRAVAVLADDRRFPRHGWDSRHRS